MPLLLAHLTPPTSLIGHPHITWLGWGTGEVEQDPSQLPEQGGCHRGRR